MSAAETGQDLLSIASRCFKGSRLEAYCTGDRAEKVLSIYEATEKMWHEYAQQLPQNKVRYLLITESAPWAPHYETCETVLPSDVEFAFNYLRPTSPFLKQLYRTVCDGVDHSNCEAAISAIADAGLLMVDALPFAFKYETKDRKTDAYKLFQSKCYEQYFIPKLEAAGLKWSKDLKVEFGYWYHGQACIEATGGMLNLPGVESPLFVTGENIVNKNVLPGYRALRRGFGRPSLGD